MLMTTGIVMVYSSSAAIAAREPLRRQEADRLTNATAAAQKPAEAAIHSPYYLKRQAIWAIIAIIALLVAYNIDYEIYRKYAIPLLAFSFFLLILVFVPGIGVERKGAHRWIGGGIFQLQASEIAKLAIIIYMARKLEERRAEVRSLLRGFLPLVGILAVFLLAIVVEPDLGTSLVIGFVVFVMWYVAGMRIVHLITLCMAAVPCTVAAILAEPYRVKRLLAFMNPEADIHNKGWQLYQSLITIGSGGAFGLGLGRGMQKYLFLSEAYTDFIFAIICEELGMIGAICIIALYVFLMVQGIRVAAHTKGLYGVLLATGITAMIGIQAFINMAVVAGLLPTKGLTLPLISYGGSSLVINAASVGILMNISRYVEITAKLSRRPKGAFARESEAVV